MFVHLLINPFQILAPPLPFCGSTENAQHLNHFGLVFPSARGDVSLLEMDLIHFHYSGVCSLLIPLCVLLCQFDLLFWTTSRNLLPFLYIFLCLFAVQTGQQVSLPLTACHQNGHRLATGVKDVHHPPFSPPPRVSVNVCVKEAGRWWVGSWPRTLTIVWAVTAGRPRSPREAPKAPEARPQQ